MKHRYAASILLTSLLFLAPVAHAATGFVDSPLLISPESPQDGDTVTLSVLFDNAETTSITGTVLFYDGQNLLAQKSLSINAGDVGIASTSFVITAGIHDFSATMTDIDKPSSTGTLEAVVIPKTTVTLPPEVITKNLGLGAQATGSSGDDSEAAILNTVDAAQTAVLNVVPPAAKNAVANTASSVDGWRSANGATFTADSDAAQASIAAGNKIDAENAARKPGSPAIQKSATADNSATAQAKYYFFAFMAFFFSEPFAFYLGSVIILYFILRFIVRRIRATRANRRVSK